MSSRENSKPRRDRENARPTPESEAMPTSEEGLTVDKEMLKDLDAPVEQANAVKGGSLVNCATR